MTKPTVLLGMPPDNEIFRLIEANLKYHGFDVVNIVQTNTHFRYPSLGARLQTKFRQIILGDKQAKHRLKTALAHRRIIDRLAQIGGVDYGLFIRADIYTPELLVDIRQYVRSSMVNYQWDGMHRYPGIQENVSLFERFYVFDPADVGPAFLPSTNFYFDHDLDDVPEPTTDFYFVGTHLAGRDASIAAFGKLAQKQGWKLDFHVCCNAKKAADFDRYRQIYSTDNISLFNRHRSFQENLQAAKQARVLVDFKTPIHNGLSFRVFEALGYRRKLITTNAEIAKYDFYHPDNIFIWDGKNFEGIQYFIEKSVCEIDPSIREKYSFGNWVGYVLGIPGHTQISLPS